jgi:hypothetical protein
MIDILPFGKRHPRVGAVHRTRGGVHQMLDALPAAALEHVQEAGDVALHVHVRILDGIRTPACAAKCTTR